MADLRGADDRPPARPSPRASWWGAVGFTVLGQGVQGVVRLGCLVIVGRFVGKEALGEVSALLAISTFLVLAWPQPAGAASARFVSRSADEGQQRAIESFTSRTVVLACLPLALVSGFLAAAWFDVGPRTVLSAALLPVCLGAATFVRGMRNGRLRFREGFLWDTVGAITTVAVMTWLVWLSAHELVLLAFCAGYLVAALPGWPRSRAGSPAGDVRRQVSRFTAWTALQVLTAGGLLPAVMAVAATTAGPAELGDMGAAVSIATPMLLLSVALRTSSVPFLGRQVARGDEAGLGRTTDSLMRASAALFVPAFGVACLWSRELLGLLYSSEFHDGTAVLVVLLLGVSVSCLNASHVWLISGPAWGARTLALCNGVGMVVGLCTAWIGSYAHATLGAALGYLVGTLVGSVPTMVVVWRRAGQRWAALAARILIGYAMIGGALVLTRDAGVDVRMVVTLAFLVVYTALATPDLRRLSNALPWRLRGP